jgi:hypothetical protein
MQKFKHLSLKIRAAALEPVNPGNRNDSCNAGASHASSPQIMAGLVLSFLLPGMFHPWVILGSSLGFPWVFLAIFSRITQG